MKKIAIFGGSGFIGSNLIELLKTTERYIYICDIVPCNYKNNNIEFVDITNLTENDLINKLNDVNEIIDLIYTTSPKTSFDDPIKDIVDNLPINVKILKIASKLKDLIKFIYVSSGGTVYGNSEGNFISENYPTNPISPYGITKLACEKYGMMFKHFYNIPIIIARPSNAYGIGQKSQKEQGFIAHAIHSIIRHNEIIIFGKNGTIRDYIYVTDIGHALLSLLEKGMPGNIYNIGTGVGKNNLEIIDELKSVAKKRIDKEIKIKVVKERPFDVKSNILDYNKINKTTGWEPRVNISEGLKNTFEWFIQQM